jgi:hypothetical protein
MAKVLRNGAKDAAKETVIPANNTVDNGANAETGANDTPAQDNGEGGEDKDADKKDADTTPPVTLETLKAAAKEAAVKAFEALDNDEITEEQKLALNLASYKASKAVTDFKNEAKAREEQAKFENEFAAWFEGKINALFEAKAANDTAKANMLPIGDAGRTKEYLEGVNTVTANYNGELEALKNLTKPAFVIEAKKKDMPIPMGMTGKGLTASGLTDKTLNGDTANAAQTVRQLFKDGKTVDEIMQLTGYQRKKITDIRWNYSKETGIDYSKNG